MKCTIVAADAVAEEVAEGGDDMPRGDGTGPQGMGPITGVARGQCNSTNVSIRTQFSRGMGLRRGFRGSDYGQGSGIRRGFGRGLAHVAFYPADKTNEMDVLTAEADV